MQSTITKNSPIRVLVIDDSSLAQKVLTKELSKDTRIQVVGTASDAFEASDIIPKLRPDVLTLDVNMPRLGGVEFLQQLMPQYPIPTIMVSSFTQRNGQITLDALSAGAVDFVTKPKGNDPEEFKQRMNELRSKICVASKAQVGKRIALKPSSASKLNTTKSEKKNTANKLIAIGASTGGTNAITTVLKAIPAASPAIAIVQHMPANFTTMFAERLNNQCQIEVKEAANGDRLTAGRALVAPGGKHMEVCKDSRGYWVKVSAGPPVSGHCPSVDVMMNSVAKVAGRQAVGAMLTGMGSDGAEGMLAMRKAGARCIAQDEKTSVVFGMPREAYRRGGAEKLVPIDKIASGLWSLL